MTRERVTSTRRFLVGKAGPFPRLVFRDDVMRRLDQFVHLRTRGEHGGFLIGYKRDLKSAEQYEILVERFVPIPQRDDATRLVITQEHLDTVHSALRHEAKHEEIVGWIHTHPGFGIFLSNFDKEQHERFFPNPWQVAFVMDNLAHERAVYHLIDRKWHRLEGYYVLKEMAENETAVTKREGTVRWSRLALTVLLIVFLIGAGGYGYSVLRPFIFPQREASFSQNPPSVETNAPVVTVERKEPPESGIAATPGQTVSGPNTVPSPNQPSLYGEYVVRKGDSLWTIAEKLWGDPRLFSIIAEENGIKNPSVIPAGTVLRIPERPKAE